MFEDTLPTDRSSEPEDESSWATVDGETLTPYDLDEERRQKLADAPAGFVMADTNRNDEPDGRHDPLPDERLDDFISIGTNADEVMNQIDDFTDDQDVLADFAERQSWTQGSEGLYERLNEHHSKSPDLSGGDLDASWEDADVSGEESVGSTTPTPDQDVVEELGEAVGILYEDEEELNTFDKLASRDENRWELDSESAEEEDDQ